MERKILNSISMTSPHVQRPHRSRDYFTLLISHIYHAVKNIFLLAVSCCPDSCNFLRGESKYCLDRAAPWFFKLNGSRLVPHDIVLSQSFYQHHHIERIG